jgi:hypothetical protein
VIAGPNGAGSPSPQDREFHAAVARAIRKAAQRARATARMYGTPIYVWQKGKVVAKKP